MTTQDDINLKFTELLGKLVDRIAGLIDTFKLMLALVRELEAKLTLTDRMAKQHDEDLWSMNETIIKLTARVHDLEARAGVEKEAANG